MELLKQNEIPYFHHVFLHRLLICSNNIASEGLCAVAKAMRVNGSLHALYIWGNKLEEPACKVHYYLYKTSTINKS